jgi:glycosyltransferase involved in cell wall biosynthesis
MIPDKSAHALYFDGVPQDWESMKAGDPTRFTIMGAGLYGFEVFKAVLNYSSYDRIFIPPVPHRPAGDFRDSKTFSDNRERLHFLPEHELSQLQSYPRLVFATPGMDLANMARLRRISRTPTAPVTGVIHSLNYSWQLRFIMLLLLSPLDSFDALICSSVAGRTAVSNLIKLNQDRLDKCGWPRLTSRLRTPIIPLGVDTAQYGAHNGKGRISTAQIPEGPVALYFGRFSASSKGDLFPLILAFRGLFRSFSNLTLVIAGDDTQYQMTSELRRLASDLGLADRVQVIPNPSFEEKKELYAAADVFLSPSDSLQETFGITVVEAMAAGLPAVVSDWDGYKDLVVHGETGYRVKTILPHYLPQFDDLRGSGDMLLPDLLAGTTMIDMQELAGYVQTLLENDALRAAMSEAARRRAVDVYDWRVVIASYEALWGELMADAEAKTSLRDEPFLDLEHFGYEEIFSHYATDFLSSDCGVRLSELGRTWKHGPQLLCKTAGHMNWFREATFSTILDLLRSTDCTTVSDVLEIAGDQTEMGQILGTAHLCRLIKYGFLETVEMPAVQQRRSVDASEKCANNPYICV